MTLDTKALFFPHSGIVLPSTSGYLRFVKTAGRHLFNAISLVLIFVFGVDCQLNAENLDPGTFGFPAGSSIAKDIALLPESAGESSPLAMTIPAITVRFANPKYDCDNAQYCVDVEFQSDMDSIELFGMNVRFFYEESVLELIDFRDFQGGYGPVAPNPPTKLTSPPAFGYNYFHFGIPGNGAAEWINGAIQLVDFSQPPVYIHTNGWTKIFQVCFTVDAPFADSTSFCPSLVLDLEENPANGGYLTADDGVVLTVVSGSEPLPVNESVQQFNWEYSGGGSASPYGDPAETNCFAFADAAIDGDDTQGCYFAPRVFQPVQEELPNIIYEWNFGVGAIPPSAIGYGPHTVYYDTAGSKLVTLHMTPSEPGAQCPDSSSISFTIINCPGNIAGVVKSTSNEPISGVNLRLFADADTNGLADNSDIIRSVFSNSLGNYSMASLLPGNYVIIEIQPTGWNSFDDGDLSDDGDLVENIDSMDNLIPVTLLPSELDNINYFTEAPIAGSITGSVFVDFDFDEMPDAGEGIPDVMLQVFADANTDGIADNTVPLFTQMTSSNGAYTFPSVPVGHYVLCEVQPAGYSSVKDFDATNDGDLVPNSNMTNDTIPVSLTNGETDANNYFIDADTCSLLVTNTNDEGPGSFRQAIICASPGDTVRFHSSLSGSTITITSSRIILDKDLVIYSVNNPRVILASQVSGFFDVEGMTDVEFNGLNMISGLAGNDGAAFNNGGTLKLQDVHILKNPFLPPGDYLIFNTMTSELFLIGSCYLDTN